jgi:predicted nucleic acid-binding protein
MRQGMLSLEQAIDIHQSAQDLLVDNEYDVSPLQVLRLSKESGCSAYDCEYVALAQHLNVRMVTADKQLLKAFPESAMALAQT